MPLDIDTTVFLGRHQQGQEIPLAIQCVTAAGVPSDPADVPVVKVYRDGASPVLVETRQLAADLRGVQVGAFRLSLFLGALYGTAGRHLVVFHYVVAGVAHTKVGSFTLNPGGSPDGAVVALKYVERPDARYLLYQTDAGRLLRGRNPR